MKSQSNNLEVSNFDIDSFFINETNTVPIQYNLEFDITPTNSFNLPNLRNPLLNQFNFIQEGLKITDNSIYIGDVVCYDYISIPNGNNISDFKLKISEQNELVIMDSKSQTTLGKLPKKLLFLHDLISNGMITCKMSSEPSIFEEENLQKSFIRFRTCLNKSFFARETGTAGFDCRKKLKTEPLNKSDVLLRQLELLSNIRCQFSSSPIINLDLILDKLNGERMKASEEYRFAAKFSLLKYPIDYSDIEDFENELVSNFEEYQNQRLFWMLRQEGYEKHSSLNQNFYQENFCSVNPSFRTKDDRIIYFDAMQEKFMTEKGLFIPYGGIIGDMDEFSNESMILALIKLNKNFSYDDNQAKLSEYLGNTSNTTLLVTTPEMLKEYRSILTTNREFQDLKYQIDNNNSNQCLYTLDLVLITYEQLFIQFNQNNLKLKNHPYHRIILDRADGLKNFSGINEIFSFKAKYRWCTTSNFTAKTPNDLGLYFKFLKVKFFEEDFFWDYLNFESSLENYEKVFRLFILNRYSPKTQIKKITFEAIPLETPEIIKNICTLISENPELFSKVFCPDEVHSQTQIISEERKKFFLAQFTAAPFAYFSPTDFESQEDLKAKIISFFEKKNKCEYIGDVIEKIKNETFDQCPICYERMRKVHFFYCGHFTCDVCEPKLKICPFKCKKCKASKSSYTLMNRPFMRDISSKFKNFAPSSLVKIENLTNEISSLILNRNNRIGIVSEAQIILDKIYKKLGEKNIDAKRGNEKIEYTSFLDLFFQKKKSSNSVRVILARLKDIKLGDEPFTHIFIIDSVVGYKKKIKSMFGEQSTSLRVIYYYYKNTIEEENVEKAGF